MDVERRDLVRERLLPYQDRCERRNSNVLIGLRGIRRDRANDEAVLPELKLLEFEILILLQLVNQFHELPRADDIDPFDITSPFAAEHEAKPASKRLLRENVCLGGVGTESNDHRHALNVPAFAQH